MDYAKSSTRKKVHDLFLQSIRRFLQYTSPIPECDILREAIPPVGKIDFRISSIK